MIKLGIFASHRGSNAQAVLDACADGSLDAQTTVMISNNSAAPALDRARAAGVPTAHLSSVTHPNASTLDAAILQTLQQHGVELVILAGYMKRLGPRTIDAYRGRILNIHPALLPRHGGQGMYGDRVHQAVIESGDTESGVTIHLVDEEYDHGPTLAEARVPVLPGDTAATLAERVLEREHTFYVETLQRITKGEIVLL